MNDYIFGKKIYKMRTNAKLSQSQLAEMLGVSNKAVSKWENGSAKPHVDMIKKLAAVFDMSVDELLSLEVSNKEIQITKIVITGGPCAGKTTAMSWIQNAFTELGYYVVFIPETATELITAGIAPWTLNSNLDYQICQIKLQLEKEKIYRNGAQSVFNYDKVLIVCDRGTMDNKAYMSDLEFSQAMTKLKLNETELRDEYDAVFHLVTAAKGAEEFYTLSNNQARTETVEEAAAMDDKLIAAWTGHPHLRVIDNSMGFEDKMKKLISEISAFLGEPEPYEIERKFLIEYPDIKLLETIPNCRKVEIIQTYLNSTLNEEERVRQRGENGNYIYFKTIKRTISGTKRVEIETRLSKDEYLTLLMNSDTSKKQIRKNRYCLTYDNQYFEIDVYPFWSDRAIAEIELCKENTAINFPDYIKVIKEVTDDENYKNSALANTGGKE
ncbi:MAG: AAA family ATPase [Clostridia bacterium]|nr:AAA family ATPase [Clostridia bacterium]